MGSDRNVFQSVATKIPRNLKATPDCLAVTAKLKLDKLKKDGVGEEMKLKLDEHKKDKTQAQTRKGEATASRGSSEETKELVRAYRELRRRPGKHQRDLRRLKRRINASAKRDAQRRGEGGAV